MSPPMYCKALIMGLLILCCGHSMILALGENPQRARHMIDFSLQDLQGQTHTLADYKGRIIFLNFWASWCPPCRSEMPALQKLYQAWDKKKYVMLAINVERDPQTVKKFTQDNGYTFPILLDQDGVVAHNYGVRGVPATFILDAQGDVVVGTVGAREWTLAEIEKLIK